MGNPSSVIAIEGAAALSAWGLLTSPETPLPAGSCLREIPIGDQSWPLGALPEEAAEAVQAMKAQKPYHRLDRATLMGMVAARYAAGNQANQRLKVGINMGSSRGATATWEHYHQTYLEAGAAHLAPHASPTTTLGHVASWVMQDLELFGPTLSHSITCSTAIQALANAEAWLQSQKVQAFLAGATEAPLTPFTLAQAQALGIHATDSSASYPSKPLAKADHNAMVLGEGAGAFWLVPRSLGELARNGNALILEATGFGNEKQPGFAAMDEAGTAFQRAMQMALAEQTTGFKVDLILMHAPGTQKGDEAELSAVETVFGDEVPALYSNKWQIGHTYGASAAIGLMQALHILETQELPGFPYASKVRGPSLTPVRKVMVNAAGFGGNAGSVIVSKPF